MGDGGGTGRFENDGGGAAIIQHTVTPHLTHHATPLAASRIQRVRGHLVVDGCIGTANSRGYFYCHERSCPFSLKLNKRGVGRGCSYDSIGTVVFPHHLHEMKTNTRVENKQIIADMLNDVEKGRDANGTLAEQYNLWQTQAAVEMKTFMDTTVQEVATINTRVNTLNARAKN